MIGGDEIGHFFPVAFITQHLSGEELLLYDYSFSKFDNTLTKERADVVPTYNMLTTRFIYTVLCFPFPVIK